MGEDAQMKSVLQHYKECWVCKTTYDLHEHHVFFGTSNRKKSEQYGMKVWLCARHHNMSNEGVHFNKPLDNRLKKFAQEYFENHIGTREDFIREFGRSYL
jgi:hypothetical protein